MNDYREPPRDARREGRPVDRYGSRPDPRSGDGDGRYQGRYQDRYQGGYQGDDDTHVLRPVVPPRRHRSDAWARAGEPGWADPRSGRPDGYPQSSYPQGGYPQSDYPGGPGIPVRGPYQPTAPYPHDDAPYYGHPPRGGALLPPPPRGPWNGGGPAGPEGPSGRRRASGRVVLGRIVAGLVSLALLVSSGLAWAAVGGTPHNPSDATDQAGSVGVVTQTTDAQGNVIAVPQTAGMNILIVGSDARTDAEGNPLTPEELKAVSTQLDGGGVSTDTVMILHVPANGAKATAISVPRDTWIGDDVVSAPGVVGPYSDGSEGPYRANKMNSFYGSAMTYEREYLVSQGVSDEADLQRRSAEAGRTMLIKVLQQFTGIKIDHYAEVNLIGFYLLSDAIGGVPVCLKNPVKDRQSGADFPAGHFEVAGSEALSFVRQRHGLPGEDLSRIRRQQAFLGGAADKILSVGTLTSPRKLTNLIDAANRSLVLDKGFDLLSFAQQMINLSSSNVTFTTIPTHGSEMIDGKSALASDTAEVQAFFANLMTDKPETSTSAPAQTSVNRSAVVVDVQNGTETPGMAAQTGTVVAAAGFQRGQLSDYPGVTPDNQQAKTTIRYPAGGEAAAALVAATLTVGEPVADDAVPSGHLLVVVGTDMPVIPADQLPTATSTPAATSGSAPSDSALTTTLPSDAISAGDVPCID